MKILYVLPATTLCGGIRIAFEHCLRLKNKGHEVFVYCTNEEISQNWFNSSFVFLNKQQVVDMFFDKVIATFWKTVYDIEKLKIKGDKYYLVQGKEPYFYFTKKEFEEVGETYKMGYKIIVIAKHLKKWLSEDFSVDSFCLTNAINHDSFYKDKDNSLATSNKKIILVEGDSVFHYKNVNYVLEGLSSLRSFVEIWYMSMSPQNTKECLYDKSFSLKDDSSIRKVYSTCDLFIKPSLLEGSSLCIMEAMACGSVVVANDIPSSREFCVNYSNSVLYKKNDKTDLLFKIKKLLNDKSQRLRISNNALKTARSFSWEDTINQLEQYLQN